MLDMRWESYRNDATRTGPGHGEVAVDGDAHRPPTDLGDGMPTRLARLFDRQPAPARSRAPLARQVRHPAHDMNAGQVV